MLNMKYISNLQNTHGAMAAAPPRIGYETPGGRDGPARPAAPNAARHGAANQKEQNEGSAQRHSGEAGQENDRAAARPAKAH